MPTELPFERRAELDWLRVVAILILHLFHCGMFFNSWGWHVKSPELLPVLEPVMTVLHLVRMPLLMLIAGAGTAFCLRKRSIGGFAGERSLRLLLPLVVGMLLVVPPQIYAERVWTGAWQGTFLDWYPSVFQFRPYPNGNLSWHHLWFVVYLYTYCILALPLLRWSRTERGEAFLDRASAWLVKGWRIYLPALSLFLGRYLLLRFDETHGLIDDPKTFVFYLQLFLLGHLFGRRPALLERVRELRWTSLVIGLLLLPITFTEAEGWINAPRVLLIWLFSWTVLLAALGHARQHIRARKPWLVRAQENAYPFYILHQTIIILVAWQSLRFPMGPWSRFGLVILVSFTLTWLGCELIRATPWLRPLFGLKGSPDKPTVPKATLEPVHTT